jgi:hypothetical protein
MKTNGIGCDPRTWSRLASAVALLAATTVGASQLTPAAHLVRSAHAESGEGLSEAAERGRRFSESDIRGSYGFFFQGFLTVQLSDDTILPVPVSAVGRLVADGRGGLPEGSRTVNLGGIVLEQVAEGSYEVRPDGTGIATTEVTIVDQTGTLPSGLTLPPTTLETFSFVLTNQAGGIPFIGRDIVDADSLEPVGAVTIRGEAHRQR